ncbi:nitrous oxide reductase accessory protein NosL [Haloarcula laminariae]|uniref:nitrous oxide reductase accessory protein NosL n=1 Tax=Haloarcula laminariae TaxID=2961577 RepID=UPI002406880E|nr:nitrous oxide reductase accessory protein NosL [Halomicroarcula sp. FL173]
MSEPIRGPTRRHVLSGTAAVLALAGCQSGGETAAPVTIEDGDNCDQCGMVISEYPGPVGETYYRDNTPTGHDEPARFCSTTCTYRHRFAKEREGWTTVATFLTDYSAVDYEVRTDGGATVLTHHLDGSAFAETVGLTVVANSDIQGSMGTAIVPFSDSADAESFAAEYGGQSLPAEDIERELISSG